MSGRRWRSGRVLQAKPASATRSGVRTTAAGLRVERARDAVIWGPFKDALAQRSSPALASNRSAAAILVPVTRVKRRKRRNGFRQAGADWETRYTLEPA